MMFVCMWTRRGERPRSPCGVGVYAKPVGAYPRTPDIQYNSVGATLCRPCHCYNRYTGEHSSPLQKCVSLSGDRVSPLQIPQKQVVPK